MTRYVSHLFKSLINFFLSLAAAGILAAMACAVPVQAQTAATAPAQTTTPEFEVASIKPVQTPNPARTRDREEGRRFSAYSVTLKELIMMAYRVDAREIAGGPAWMATDEYDIEAVAGDGVQVNEHLGELLQKLLADRFQLAFHREQRVLPAYALTVAKGGSKLKTAEQGGGQGASCEHMGVCNFGGVPLVQFTRWLSFVVVDRPVVDKTGITGTFDFSLKWTPDESQFSALALRAPVAADNPNAPPPLFEAIEEQLGLKLEPEKMPAEVLVIDKVERPTEN